MWWRIKGHTLTKKKRKWKRKKNSVIHQKISIHPNFYNNFTLKCLQIYIFVQCTYTSTWDSELFQFFLCCYPKKTPKKSEQLDSHTQSGFLLSVKSFTYFHFILFFAIQFTTNQQKANVVYIHLCREEEQETERRKERRKKKNRIYSNSWCS